MDTQELRDRIDTLCAYLKGLNVVSREARVAAAEECDLVAEDLRFWTWVETVDDRRTTGKEGNHDTV